MSTESLSGVTKFDYSKSKKHFEGSSNKHFDESSKFQGHVVRKQVQHASTNLKQ